MDKLELSAYTSSGHTLKRKKTQFLDILNCHSNYNSVDPVKEVAKEIFDSLFGTRFMTGSYTIE